MPKAGSPDTVLCHKIWLVDSLKKVLEEKHGGLEKEELLIHRHLSNAQNRGVQESLEDLRRA